MKDVLWMQERKRDAEAQLAAVQSKLQELTMEKAHLETRNRRLQVGCTLPPEFHSIRPAIDTAAVPHISLKRKQNHRVKCNRLLPPNLARSKFKEGSRMGPLRAQAAQ